MPEKTIHIIGYDEMVYLFGLMGIPGTVLEDPKLFKDKFNKIRKDPSVSMIIISMDLPDNLIDFVSEFKLNNRTPFVYYMPEIFQRNIEQSSAVLDKLLKSIQKILR
jgi:vacuolar-type H+-ATPase subunit F/Vma7